MDRILQYYCIYGVEPWLIDLKDYDDNMNTWERWENLTSTEVQGEAADVHHSTVKAAANVFNFIVHTLKANLAHRPPRHRHICV